ncbi:MAG: hypothetical protein AAGI01_18640, partial [Myxococcota bacterium]
PRAKNLGDSLSSISKRHASRRKDDDDRIDVVRASAAKGSEQATLIAIEQLRTDGGTQPRVAMDTDLVAVYAERMSVNPLTHHVEDHEGVGFDPLVVFEDASGVRWLADGFHRVAAAKRAGVLVFQASVQRGSQRDAFVFSLGVNATHGKRRTNQDKRRAVERALHDLELVKHSDQRLAKVCKVTDRYVSKVRRQLESDGAIAIQERVLGTDGQWHEILRETPKSSPSPTTSASARARRAPTRHRNVEGRAPSIAFDELCAVDQNTKNLLMVHPLRALDFEALAEHAAHIVCAPGLIAIALPQDGPLALTGPALLAPLLESDVFSGPSYAHLREHGRVYMFLGRRAELPSGDCSLGALSSLTRRLIVGDALDAW